MGRKAVDSVEFLNAVKAHNVDVVYVDRHSWGYHIWFVPNEYRYDTFASIKGKTALMELLETLSELEKMKVKYLIVTTTMF